MESRVDFGREESPKRPGGVEQVPIPKPGPGEAVIRVTLTTICGTDLHILKGEYPVKPGLTSCWINIIAWHSGSFTLIARRTFRARESNSRFHRICGSPTTADLFDVYAIEDCVRGVGFPANLTYRIRCLPPQGPFFEPKLGLKSHPTVLRRVWKFLIASKDNNT